MEFHGWIKIAVADDGVRLDADEIIQRARDAGHLGTDEFSHIEIRNAGNGLVYADFHGIRNHFRPNAPGLFRWIAQTYDRAYGILHIWDDESEHDNEFRILRAVRGGVTEVADSFFSPCFPTIDDEFDGATNDDTNKEGCVDAKPSNTPLVEQARPGQRV